MLALAYYGAPLRVWRWLSGRAGAGLSLALTERAILLPVLCLRLHSGFFGKSACAIKADLRSVRRGLPCGRRRGERRSAARHQRANDEISLLASFYPLVMSPFTSNGYYFSCMGHGIRHVQESCLWDLLTIHGACYASTNVCVTQL